MGLKRKRRLTEIEPIQARKRKKVSLEFPASPFVKDSLVKGGVRRKLEEVYKNGGVRDKLEGVYEC